MEDLTATPELLAGKTLFFHAHPDDDLLSGHAFLAWCYLHNKLAGIVTATRGERGEITASGAEKLEKLVKDASLEANPCVYSPLALIRMQERQAALDEFAAQIRQPALSTLPTSNRDKSNALEPDNTAEGAVLEQILEPEIPTFWLGEKEPSQNQPSGKAPAGKERSANQLSGSQLHEKGLSENQLRKNAADPALSHIYCDSGMTWDERTGLATFDPSSGPDCFSKGDADVQAAEIAALVIKTGASSIITYGSGGGYGHPDHRQAHLVAQKACKILAGQGLSVALWTLIEDAKRSGNLDFHAGAGDKSKKQLYIDSRPFRPALLAALAHYDSQLTVVDENHLKHVGGQVQVLTDLEAISCEILAR